MFSAWVDGSIPHIMIQTATPIPQSTAQMFYGDVDMIELREKPPGCLPIVTKWVQEDSLSVLEQATNEIWTDVINEAHNVVCRLASGEGQRILFTRTKHLARRLARKLVQAGIPAVELQGNKIGRAHV